MMYALVTSSRGVNELVAVYDSDAVIIEKLNRWLPELRAGRVQIQDFGYKRSVLSEDGYRCYEIFEVANKAS